MGIATSQILLKPSDLCNWFMGHEAAWVNQDRPPQNSLQWGSFLQYPYKKEVSGPPVQHEGSMYQEGQSGANHHFEVKSLDISLRIICLSFLDMSVSTSIQCLMNFCFSFRGISITSLSGCFRFIVVSILDPVIYHMVSGCQEKGVS